MPPPGDHRRYDAVTLVLVHGAPETSVVWEPMVAALDWHGLDPYEAVALSPPGFGAPVPDGFGATMAEYGDWLAAELMQLLSADRGPLDLLGHDWGGVHVIRVAMTHPELIRSWCSDAAGAFHSEFEWSDEVRARRSPAGEAVMRALPDLSQDDRIDFCAKLGMGAELAKAAASHIDADMAHCMLALAQDAAQPAMADLGFNIAAASQCPGLCIKGEKDSSTGTKTMHRNVARRAGALFTEMLDLGHWWMYEDPGVAAYTVATWITAVMDTDCVCD